MTPRKRLTLCVPAHKSITTEAQRRTEGAEESKAFDQSQKLSRFSAPSVSLCASVVMLLERWRDDASNDIASFRDVISSMTAG
jgi:hypothetical protein